MKINRGVAGLVLVLALIGTAGCDGGQPGQGSAEQSAPGTAANGSGSGASSNADTRQDAAGKATIIVEDFKYQIPGSVRPGATITVVNKDDAPHTVTSKDNGAFDAIFEPGETVTFTAPEEPGEYPFFCVYHPNMTGTLVVK